MKKSILIVVVMVCTSAYSAFKPIEYHVQKNYHRMMVVLNGDVQWQVNRSGEKMEILVTGAEENFVVRNMKYNFQSGVIKEFVIQPKGHDQRKITIQLRRNVTEYKIYQENETKNLFIEFYPGKEAAVNTVPVRTPVISEKQTTAPAKNTLVNIPQVVLDQVESEPPAQKNEEKLFVPTKQSPVFESPAPKSNAAMWLLFVAVSIFFAGGSFVFFTVMKRKQWMFKKSGKNAPSNFFQHLEKNLAVEPAPAVVSTPSPVLVDTNEEDFSHSIEFAEQYLRSQGELDLHMRLEKLTAHSSHKKIEKLPKFQKGKGDSKVLTAQKLGLSVGELELVSRLQKYRKRQSTEVV